MDNNCSNSNPFAFCHRNDSTNVKRCLETNRNQNNDTNDSNDDDDQKDNDECDIDGDDDDDDNDRESEVNDDVYYDE